MAKSQVKDVLYIIDNTYEVRYFWSIKQVVKAYAGRWAHADSVLHVFSPSGVVTTTPSHSLLLEAAEKAQEAAGVSLEAYRQVIADYTHKIETAQ